MNRIILLLLVPVVFVGAYDGAITEYSEAIRLKPDLWMTYENRARIYETIGDTAKAQADRNKISELKF